MRFVRFELGIIQLVVQLMRLAALELDLGRPSSASSNSSSKATGAIKNGVVYL